MSRLFAGTPLDRPPTCERCGLPKSDCACPPVEMQKAIVPPGKQTATLRTEKRNKGKLVTVVRGLAAADNDLPSLLTRLKSACGAGGSIDGDELVIQGDHVARLKALLAELGYRLRG